MKARVKKNGKNDTGEQVFKSDVSGMRMGGVEKEGYVFKGEISQSCGAEREKEGIIGSGA